MQDVRDVGPLERGAYTIAPMRTNKTGSNHTLPNSMRLIPHPSMGKSKTRDRGYLIHGGNMKNNSSSKGCPVLPLQIRKAIGNSKDRTLIVVE